LADGPPVPGSLEREREALVAEAIRERPESSRLRSIIERKPPEGRMFRMISA
jgi:hypothetical protein